VHFGLAGDAQIERFGGWSAGMQTFVATTADVGIN
jgi:hypothetical protein